MLWDVLRLNLGSTRATFQSYPLKGGLIGSFMSLSTVGALALASFLTPLAVSSLTVREYQPPSGINIDLADAPKRLTGQFTLQAGAQGPYIINYFISYFGLFVCSTVEPTTSRTLSPHVLCTVKSINNFSVCNCRTIRQVYSTTNDKE